MVSVSFSPTSCSLYRLFVLCRSGERTSGRSWPAQPFLSTSGAWGGSRGVAHSSTSTQSGIPFLSAIANLKGGGVSPSRKNNGVYLSAYIFYTYPWFLLLFLLSISNQIRNILLVIKMKKYEKKVAWAMVDSQWNFEVKFCWHPLRY